MVKIQANYLGELGCDALHVPSGSRLRTDAPVDNGGKGATFSPTDLVATALGTCVMTICGLVAERHGWDLSGMSVEVDKEMVADPVRRIGRLSTMIAIPATAVPDPADRQRLETAARKCPVHQSLHPSIEATIDFRYF